MVTGAAAARPIIPNAPAPSASPPLTVFRRVSRRPDAPPFVSARSSICLLVISPAPISLSPADFVDGIASVMTGCKQKARQKWQVRGPEHISVASECHFAEGMSGPRCTEAEQQDRVVLTATLR